MALTEQQQALVQNLEIEMMADMFTRLQNTCLKKCIPTTYNDPDLTKGESVCLDRCVAKYMDIHERIGKKLTEMSVQDEETMKKLQFLARALQGVISQSQSRTMSSIINSRQLIFRQLFEKISSTYTYLLADAQSRDAILIDPVIDTVERDERLVRQLDLKLNFVVNTHCHADHVTGTGRLKQLFPGTQSMIGRASSAKADIYLEHGSTIPFGQHKLECRSTPGHTAGCLTYVFHENRMAFTGDALLIRGCGRTDFQEGSPNTLYKSVHEHILSLPDDFLLFPAHDYSGTTVTTVGEEKKHNKRLTKSLEEFIDIMNNLGLPYPKQIDKAVPANLVCGVYDVDPPK